MSPRRAPGGPRSGPRAPKTAARGAQSAPRGAQDHPGPPQESTQGAQAAQTPPGSPSGAHFGLILEPPGPHFRAFEASFSSLARGPLDRRKHWSKSLVKRSFATAAGQMCRGHCPLNY